jgi:hypothetical protein
MTTLTFPARDSFLNFEERLTLSGIRNGTLSLLHGDGADASTVFTDELGNVWTAVGDAQIDTDQYFHTSIGSSIKLGGTGYLTTPDAAKWAFAGDFAIRGKFRFGALPSATSVGICTQLADWNNWHGLYLMHNGGVYYLVFHQITAAVTDIWVGKVITPSVDTWYDIELVRSGNDYSWRLGGLLVGTVTTDATPINNLASVVYVGSIGGALQMTGWIAEFEIDNFAAHTADFTPVAPAMPAVGMEERSVLTYSQRDSVLTYEEKND